MNNEYDVVIVGAGFGGIQAALTLEKYKLKVCVIDEGVLPGGQFIRYSENNKNSNTPPTYVKGLELVKQFNESTVTYLQESTLIFINNTKEMIVKLKDDSLKRLNPKTIILATGASEIVHPFLGWDLPGIMTTGALQILLKTSGKRFSDEITIAGSGILPYAAASTWLDKGGKISNFYDSNNFSKKLSMLTSALSSKDKRSDLFALLPDMLKIQMKAKNNTKIIEARGNGKLESIVLAKVDRDGNVIKGSEFEKKVSLLAIGNGLIANTEAAITAGCKTVYDEKLGGLIVDVDDYLETSIKGIFTIGASTGICGADKSQLEGELSAYSVLNQLNKISKTNFKNKTSNLRVQRHKMMKFTNLLSSMQEANLNELNNLDDNTTICRCENIKIGFIKEAIENGSTSINSIKKRTRAGMGNCQGKTCSQLVRNILMSNGVKDTSAIKARPPLRPTSINILSSKITFLEQ